MAVLAGANESRCYAGFPFFIALQNIQTRAVY